MVEMQGNDAAEDMGTSLLRKQMLDGNETLVGTTPDIYPA